MRFQMEKLTENTVRDDNVLVYKSADISDADLLIRIYNSHSMMISFVMDSVRHMASHVKKWKSQ